MTIPDKDDTDLGARLLAAVPPLQDPPDRLAAVAGRVRRARRRAVLGSAAAVLVLAAGTSVGLAVLNRGTTVPVAAPGSVAPAPTHAGTPVSAVTCPLADPLARIFMPTRTSGDLVPAGATSVTMCQFANPRQPRRTTPSSRGRRLVDGTAQVVAILNSLPQMPTKPLCNPAGFANTVLVFAYPDGRTLVVAINSNCRLAITSEHGGRSWQNQVGAVDRLEAMFPTG